MRGDDTRSMERIREYRNTAQTAAALAERKRQHRLEVFLFSFLCLLLLLSSHRPSRGKSVYTSKHSAQLQVRVSRRRGGDVLLLTTTTV